MGGTMAGVIHGEELDKPKTVAGIRVSLRGRGDTSGGIERG